MSMLEKLMPKSDDFFADFEAQAATVVEGAKLLKDLLDDFTDVPRKCQAIKDVEHRGDDITHRAFARLHTQFITPFDRAEIHRLLSAHRRRARPRRRRRASGSGSTTSTRCSPRPASSAAVLVAQVEKMVVAVKGLRDMKKDPDDDPGRLQGDERPREPGRLPHPPRHGEALQARATTRSRS